MDDKESLIKLLEKEGQEYEFFGNGRVRTSKQIAGVHYHEGELYFVHSLIGNNGTYFQFIPYLKGYSLKERPFYTTWGNGEELTDDEFQTIIQL